VKGGQFLDAGCGAWASRTHDLPAREQPRHCHQPPPKAAPRPHPTHLMQHRAAPCSSTVQHCAPLRPTHLQHRVVAGGGAPARAPVRVGRHAFAVRCVAVDVGEHAAGGGGGAPKRDGGVDAAHLGVGRGVCVFARVCVCVCVYLCVCVCVRVRESVRPCMHGARAAADLSAAQHAGKCLTYVRLVAGGHHTAIQHAQTLRHTSAYTHTHARTHGCTHARTHARTHACMHACTHTHTHARTHTLTRTHAPCAP